MSGVPVRLVRKNGELIELLATDITLDVQRKTGGIALPFSGSTRVGFDFNMNNAVIILNGVITDDDVVHTTTQNTASKAHIDFSATQSSVTRLDDPAPWSAVIDRLITTQDASSSDAVNIAAADHAIQLIQADGSLSTIYLAISASTYGLSAGRLYISVNDSSGSNRAPADIAGYLNSLINGSLSSYFTSTLNTSDITGSANTKVVISSVVKSSAANTASPAFTSAVWPSHAAKPYHRKFRGGVDVTTKSAGDKVMDLFGTLNNSNNGGAGQVASSFLAGSLASAASGGTPMVGLAVGAATYAYLDTIYGDYIIGIQIPYNSMVKATGSNKYDPVNFFMPTGPLHNADSKGSSKAEPAGTKFEWINNDYTGIQGTVQKATFVQLGGEPIYQFTIIFAPIDIII